MPGRLKPADNPRHLSVPRGTRRHPDCSGSAPLNWRHPTTREKRRACDPETGRDPARPPSLRGGSPRVRWLAVSVALALVVLAPRSGAAAEVVPPLPPPPATKAPGRAPAAAARNGARSSARPGAARTGRPSAAPGATRRLTQGRVLHGALEKHDCTSCHRAVTGEAGKCRSRTASKWALVRTEPELCYGCHARKDQSKSVHTVIRQGSCLSCHAAHSSDFAGLITQPREKICFDCHDADSLSTKPVKHAPVAEGRCLDCHDAARREPPEQREGGERQRLLPEVPRREGADGQGHARAPATGSTSTKKVVHARVQADRLPRLPRGRPRLGQPEAAQEEPGGPLLRLPRAEGQVEVPAHRGGRWATARSATTRTRRTARSSSRRPTIQETCFLCHQDDLTGRKVVHAPVAKGCDQCHDPHGAQNRYALKGGEGKAGCYKCHKPVDGGKVKHAALERYGCTGCHDPHGTANASMAPQEGERRSASRATAEQKDGQHVTPSSPAGHVVGGDLNDPRRAGARLLLRELPQPPRLRQPEALLLRREPRWSRAPGATATRRVTAELKNVIKKAQRAPRRHARPGAAGGGGAGSPGAGGGTGPGSGAGGGA